MSQPPSDFFDTDGRPTPAGSQGESERKLKVWAVLNAVDQGLMSNDEARTAYGISAEEMEQHRAGWRSLGDESE
jgi:hypothetical protein